MATGINIGLALKGDRRLRRAFEKLEGKDQRKVVRKALRTVGKDLQRDIKQSVPADVLRAGSPSQQEVRRNLQRRVKVRATKRSRRSIGVRVGFFAGEGDDVGIEHHIELGTRLSPPQPFMRPALQRRKRDLAARFRDVVRELVRIARRTR